MPCRLNIYGFQRCRTAQATVEGGMGELEFYHELFVAGRKDLVKQISRGGIQAQPKRRVAEISDSDKALSLSNEMSLVHQQITALDTQLSQSVQSLQSKMELLIDTLHAETTVPPPQKQRPLPER